MSRGHIAWKGAEDEKQRVLAALEGEEGPVRVLILYNAALRLSLAEETAPITKSVDRADDVLRSGAVLELLDRLRRPALV